MNQEKLGQVLENMQDSLSFLKEKVLTLEKNGATKEDLKRFATKDDLKLMHDSILRKVATKEELAAVNSNLVSHIDGLAHRHERLDLEMLAIRAKSDRLESHVQQLAKHANLALE